MVYLADNQPFEDNMIQACYYDDHVGYNTLQGFNKERRLTHISVQKAIEVSVETVHQDLARLRLVDIMADPDGLIPNETSAGLQFHPPWND
ncbi:hypothetical protein ACFX1X_023418 [Malus domestica]